MLRSPGYFGLTLVGEFPLGAMMSYLGISVYVFSYLCICVFLYLVFGYFGLTPVGAFPLGAMMSGPESSTPAGQRLPRKDDNDDDIIIIMITMIITTIVLTIIIMLVT